MRLRGTVMRKLVLVLTFLAIATLTGCTRMETVLKDVFFKQSKIEEDGDYQEYQSLESQKQLNEEGFFYDKDISESFIEPELPQVHVTFANNKYMSISYFREKEKMKEIDTKVCYLNPGSMIYGEVQYQNPYTNSYQLAEYRIYDYSGEQPVLLERNVYPSEFIYEIPEDFKGTELQIVPIGEYLDRVITAEAYCLDENKQKSKFFNVGNWAINNEVCIPNEPITVNPIEPYILKFDFDDENFFFVRSEPECYTKDPNKTGIVEFWEQNPTDENVIYEVELKPYLSLSILLSDEGAIWLNDEPQSLVKKRWESQKLKYNDEIVIETEGTCSLMSGDFSYVRAVKDPIKGKVRYSLWITPEGTDNHDILDINDYVAITLKKTGKYGTCTYKVDGKEVPEGTITLQKKQKLEMIYLIETSGYKFKESDIFEHKWLIFGKPQKTVTIPISLKLNEKEFDPDYWVDIVPKK